MYISKCKKYISLSPYHVNDNEEPGDWISSQEKAKSYTKTNKATKLGNIRTSNRLVGSFVHRYKQSSMHQTF